uniref:O-phosphoseryl-tRNA(Sec) selenium transferase n=1 Tax=Anopheles culicifacies TaxID=139723 RepID=A0A182LWR3_9DIPT
MNDTTLKSIAKSLVPENYLALANDARAEHLVRRKHYNFSHGIGRSGNLTDAQPKAAGSTIMSNLTNSLVCDLIRSVGIPNCTKAIIIPLATGMTMMLALRAIHSKRPTSCYVLWSRVDQQSCFKSISAAGLTPISSYFSHQLNQGARTGRIDAFIQSTDKNLLVPVGGAIVGGFTTDTVDAIAQLYPGRASGTQSLDVLMTLLSLGKKGYESLMQEQKEAHKMLLDGLTHLAQTHGEHILPCRNPISIAMSLVSFQGNSSGRLEMIGSMLQKRGVSGCRVVTTTESKTIDGNTFLRWGSHSSNASVPYLTASAALGIKPQEIAQHLNDTSYNHRPSLSAIKVFSVIKKLSSYHTSAAATNYERPGVVTARPCTM